MLSREILLAEDDVDDVALLQRAFFAAGVNHRLHVVSDGQEAIDSLVACRRREPDLAPALAILDLKMPRRNGLEVLQWIRADEALSALPVFIFSSSDASSDVEPAYACGANCYLVKPPSIAQRRAVAGFIDDWLKVQVAPLAVTQGLQAAANFKRSLANAAGVLWPSQLGNSGAPAFGAIEAFARRHLVDQSVAMLKSVELIASGYDLEMLMLMIGDYLLIPQEQRTYGFQKRAVKSGRDFDLHVRRLGGDTSP